MSQNHSDDLNTGNSTSNNASVPQNITYITTIDPGQQNSNRMVSHRRTISIVSQSTLSADVFLTPQSVRHEDFVKKSWLENGHHRSASSSSFFSVVSEKDKQGSGMKDNSVSNALVVDVRNGYSNHGFVNGTETDYPHHNSVFKDSTTCEQYWACKDLSSREKGFIILIVLLILCIFALISVMLYMHYYEEPDKNIARILPPWMQGQPPSVQR